MHATVVAEVQTRWTEDASARAEAAHEAGRGAQGRAASPEAQLAAVQDAAAAAAAAYVAVADELAAVSKPCAA